MIPKIIHYCWFGKGKKSKKVETCIDSWKKYFPDYQIIEWNEENYDVFKIPYIKGAYENKKYAFVSDYARCDILFNYGGLYFDTDVEVIKDMNDILKNGQFLGVERSLFCHHDSDDFKKEFYVNPGLGMGFEKGNCLLKDVMKIYEQLEFLDSNGNMNLTTIGRHFTKLLIEKGLTDTGEIQTIDNIVIYPTTYFNPLENATGRLFITKETKTIHWYSKSWMTKRQRYISEITKVFHRLFGVDCFSFLKKK